MEFFDEAECWSRDQIEQTQLSRLRSTVAQTRKCDFYRQRLDEAGVGPDSIRSLDDLRRIPFTTKQDLRSQYPTGLLCVPQSEIVRMHCSSGTTGSPVAICHTQNDINSWADLMARSIHMVGVRRDDVFQNMSGYGLFTGGLGAHYGAERVGASVIPVSGGNTVRQLMLMEDFGSTALCCTPSYALNLAEAIEREGSISAAARALGMSYRRAWQLVEETNRALREPAVVTAKGGAHGGGAALTATGETVVQCYRALEAAAVQASATEIATLRGLMAP